MDWTQTLTIIGITVAFFIFMMNRMDANQKENNKKFEVIQDKFEFLKKDVEQKISEEIRDLKSDMNQRLTDTNQRLSDFRTDVNQRLSTIEGYLVPRKVFRFEETDHKEEPKEN